jgi:hypothetical protein
VLPSLFPLSSLSLPSLFPLSFSLGPVEQFEHRGEGFDPLHGAGRKGKLYVGDALAGECTQALGQLFGRAVQGSVGEVDGSDLQAVPREGGRARDRAPQRRRVASGARAGGVEGSS